MNNTFVDTVFVTYAKPALTTEVTFASQKKTTHSKKPLSSDLMLD